MAINRQYFAGMWQLFCFKIKKELTLDNGYRIREEAHVLSGIFIHPFARACHGMSAPDLLIELSKEVGKFEEAELFRELLNFLIDQFSEIFTGNVEIGVSVL